MCFLVILFLGHYVTNHRSLLMSLMMLEAISLMLVTAILLSRSSSSEILILSIILAFSACEASLGLACLVSMIRVLGKDSLVIVKSMKF